MEESADIERFLASGGDAALARLAERQHGVVSVLQLAALGVTANAARQRAATGRLHRIHRGVYAVGHPRLSWRGHLWAGVLATGGPARVAISHRSAAAVWDILSVPSGPVDVAALGTSRSTAALRVHRGEARDATTDGDDGLPVTTPARTLVDLAAVLSPHRLERACHRAALLRLLDHAAVERLLTGARRPGARALRAALATLGTSEPQVTRSELEERLLALVAHAGLPRPAVNARVLGHEVDFLWRDQRLVVETDGAAAHLTRAAFEEDRRRDARLQVAGLRVVRFTWRQLDEQPGHVTTTLATLLAA